MRGNMLIRIGEKNKNLNYISTLGKNRINNLNGLTGNRNFKKNLINYNM